MAAIMKTKSPKEQKALGKETKGFTNDIWDTVKYQIVVRGNMLKFTQCDIAPHDKFIYPEGMPSGRDGIVSLKEVGPE